MSFQRTFSALERDRYGRSFMLALVAILVLAGWVCWAVLAPVSVVAVSVHARLEVDTQVHSVQAPVAGRVVTSNLALGREVQRGEPLLVLDTEVEQRKLVRTRVRVEGLGDELRALRRELQAMERAVRDQDTVRNAAVMEAEARARETAVSARFARDEAARAHRLYDAGVLPPRELDRSNTEAQRSQASLDHAAQVSRRAEAEGQASSSQLRVRLEEGRARAIALEGEERAARAEIALLEQEIARRTLAAPVAGRLGEVATLAAGAFIEEGQRVASVVPDGRIHVLAEYSGSDALGRIRVGQPARVRLDGFPWTEFGTLPAQVSRAASELRGDTARVELDLIGRGNGRIPVQHGLPGVAEIEIERATPLVLLGRMVGRALSGAGP